MSVLIVVIEHARYNRSREEIQQFVNDFIEKLYGGVKPIVSRYIVMDMDGAHNAFRGRKPEDCFILSDGHNLHVETYAATLGHRVWSIGLRCN